MSICPHCNKQIGSLIITTHTGYANGKTWNCATYDCPNCHKVLSAQIDPIAIKTDTINELRR